MALHINLEHPEHNPHVPGTERRHVLACWLAAGSMIDVFDEWWTVTLERLRFDNLRALCGLAWETSWQLAGAAHHGESLDADPDLWFAVWWDQNAWSWAPPAPEMLSAEQRTLLGLATTEHKALAAGPVIAIVEG